MRAVGRSVAAGLSCWVDLWLSFSVLSAGSGKTGWYAEGT